MNPSLHSLPHRLLTTASLLLFAGSLPTNLTAADPADAAKANNAFGLALLQKVPASDKNLVYSPFSIWSALSMTSAGADKETLAQMRKVLRLSDDESAHTLAGKWSQGLVTSTKGLEVRVANRLWGEKSLPFLDTFLQASQQNYGAGLEEVDFKNKPEPARQRINAWVSDQTKSRIKDLLAEGIITPDTRMVLTNAVYFLGDWAQPFSANDTSTHAFTGADGKSQQVKMMYKGFKGLSYMENGKLQAIRLGYVGDRYSMVVVLPRKADALMGHSLTGESTFKSVVSALKPAKKVLVSLPRFEARSSLELKPLLADMGMARAFSADAEFGKMCEEPLKISAVVHQAWVKVAEKGTEAAAATAVVMMPTMAAPPQEEPKVFRADRPFLFYIVENATNGILFAGKVMQPELAK